MNPKLPVVSGNDLIRVLTRLGYEVARQRGSHVRLRHPTDSRRRPVTVPLHDELAFGTLKRFSATRNSPWKNSFPTYSRTAAVFPFRFLRWRSAILLGMGATAGRKKAPKFAFVVEELQDSPLAARVRTRPMFGCHAVYVDQRILFILRQKDDPKTRRDNGVWVATQPEHNASLQRDFPALRPIELFSRLGRKAFYGWLILPDSVDSFEESALALCRLAIAGDPRIGKLPKQRSPRKRR